MTGSDVDRCGFEWPQSDEELRTAVADCPHNCTLPKAHEGHHTCCNGRAICPGGEDASTV